MLKMTSIFLHTGHMKQLKTLAESQGLKTAQLVRISIADYLRRATKRVSA
jgi:16S rRNA U516 pseudouridylate synthase RsuA-like enzyme